MRFERRAYILVSREGQRPAYDDYVISHRIRARERLPHLGFAIPVRGARYPRSSWPAQLLALRVQDAQPARLPALEDALFGAMFRELRDISDPAVLRGCAAEAGVPEAEVAAALEDPALRQRAAAEHDEALHLGVSGIPALALPGHFPLTGAMPVEHYRAAIEASLEGQRRGEIS